MTTSDNKQPQFLFGMFLLVVIFVLCCVKCKAQQRTTAVYDTIPAKNECIIKFVKEQTNRGTEKIYCVYNDANLSDLIPVSQTVYKYIQLCTANGLRPKLGIRFRNGQINGIIKYKNYEVAHRRTN